MHERLHCDNHRCEYNIIASELCNAKNTYYDHRSGRCMTFKKHDSEPSTKELMNTFNSNCERSQRGYRSKRTGMALK